MLRGSSAASFIIQHSDYNSQLIPSTLIPSIRQIVFILPTALLVIIRGLLVKKKNLLTEKVAYSMQNKINIPIL